jgi:hypothetical protein
MAGGRGSAVVIATGNGNGNGNAYLTTLATAWTGWTDADRLLVPFPQRPRVGTFSRATVGMTDEGTHVLGVTTDGRLWHQLRANCGGF